MPPEQRLTVREAVELIARHGAAPISESALRARIRNRKIGAVRVNGRVYTNPLNLVAAGLLPVEALSGPIDSASDIDDAELHAWLNPDEPEAAGKTDPPLPFTSDAVDADARDAVIPSNDDADVGPLERALSRSSPESPPTSETPSPSTSVASGMGTTQPAALPSATYGNTGRAARWRRPLIVACAAIAAAAAAFGLSVADDQPAAEIVQLNPVAIASAADAGPSVDRVSEAMAHRDYAKAVELAALSGDRPLLERTQREAADVLLARAERARRAGQRRAASQHVRAARRLGDPRPSATSAVAARINRDERLAQRQASRRRAAAARASTAQSPRSTSTPSPAAGPSASTANGSNSSSAPSASRPEASSTPPASATPKKDTDQAVDPGLF